MIPKKPTNGLKYFIAVFQMNKLLLALLLVVTVHAQIYDSRSVIDDVTKDSVLYIVMPTGSMVPTFDEDDLLIVKKVPFKSLKKKDIIIYNNKKLASANGYPDAMISHRIISCSSGGSVVVTKGDANEFVDDEWVTEEMFVGLVVGTIKRPIL